MKVIKRNGEEQNFSAQKILSAIDKANKSMEDRNRLPSEQVDHIYNAVISRCEAAKHILSVEEIQDMVEDAIMAAVAAFPQAAAVASQRVGWEGSVPRGMQK